MARNLPRNVRIAGRRTSMRLEKPFWDALVDIARRESTDVDSICTAIAAKHRGWGLSSAVRIETMNYYRTRQAQLDAYALAAEADAGQHKRRPKRGDKRRPAPPPADVERTPPRRRASETSES